MKLCFLVCFLVCLVSLGCTATSVPSEKLKKGVSVNHNYLETALSKNKASSPVTLKKHISAKWEVDLEGLLDLTDEKAVAAGIENKMEPIEVSFYELNHEKFGSYIIDTGIAKKFFNDIEGYTNFGVRSAMPLEALDPAQFLGDWVENSGKDLKAVFLTHMHLDHISGLPDLDESIPIITGPNEPTNKNFLNLFVRGTIDAAVGENRKIYTLSFDGENYPVRILDFFGDGSFYIASVPGHTAGSLAFIVRAQDGDHLVTGDSCHTAWGWNNRVTPGKFTEDKESNKKALTWLKELSGSNPEMAVHVGHQTL